MNVLVVGNGSREHAICWKLRQSPHLGLLFCAPGNAGTRLVAENVALNPADHQSMALWCRTTAIDLVIIGPEAPLADGLADSLSGAGLLVFGPSAAAARIESSKIWTKEFARRHGIPSAHALATAEFEQAMAALEQFSFPMVIKADGLAAGKGVAIVESSASAEAIVRGYLLEDQLGPAGKNLLVEEFLEGVEVSLLAFTDGERYAPMPPARDHKRISDGDRGPNTGGMGAFAPVPDVDVAALADQFIGPAVRGLAEEGHPFRGVLYAGLMLTTSGPKLIEYNCRFGDPETQVLLPLLETDLLEICEAVAQGKLDPAAVTWRDDTACGVVMAASGYPGTVRSGDVVQGFESVPSDVKVFQAGTTVDSNGRTVTAGGRVLTVTGLGANIDEARARAYAGVEALSFDGAQIRSDIGLPTDRQARGMSPTMTGTDA
ncbi:MAG: phosphoribosylamine--glycine ligase [Chloroflexota bacterium]